MSRIITALLLAAVALVAPPVLACWALFALSDSNEYTAAGGVVPLAFIWWVTGACGIIGRLERWVAS